MPAVELLRQLESEIVAESLIPADAGVVVAVSGGPDSMALLHALVTLTANPSFAWRLQVAHLNHGLRGAEADADAAFVQAAADGYDLPCTIEKADVAAQAAELRVSIEEASRNARYRFLERVCLEYDAGFAAVGHQADDNVETILQRILRGTGLRGLAGIPRSRPLQYNSPIKLVRPLLNFSRKSILEFNQAQGVAFREDATNQQPEPTRNRIRNAILPMLAEQVNPQVREALRRLAEQARWVNDYVEETTRTVFTPLIIGRTDQELSLNAAALARRSRIVQAELVRRAVTSFQLGEQEIGYQHLSAVLDLIGERTSGKQVHLPGGMTVTKLYERLVFAVPSDKPRETIAAEIVIRIPGRTTLPMHGVDLSAEIVSVSAAQAAAAIRETHPGEEWMDYEQLHAPLVVRHRRPGDRFWPLGAPGSKKVSEFLSNAKVDPDERERVTLLCDRLGPVWVIGHRIDERAKLTRQTRRILKLRAQRI